MNICVIEIRPPTEETYVASTRAIGANGRTDEARTDGQTADPKHKLPTTPNVNRRERKEGLLPRRSSGRQNTSSKQLTNKYGRHYLTLK